MADFFKWLSNDSSAAKILIPVFCIGFALLLLMFFIAVVQGRKVSIWPPQIDAHSIDKTKQGGIQVPPPLKNKRNGTWVDAEEQPDGRIEWRYWIRRKGIDHAGRIVTRPGSESTNFLKRIFNGNADKQLPPGED